MSNYIRESYISSGGYVEGTSNPSNRETANYYCPHCRGVLVAADGPGRFECRSCGEVVAEVHGGRR